MIIPLDPAALNGFFTTLDYVELKMNPLVMEMLQECCAHMQENLSLARRKSLHKTSVLLDASFHDATCRLAPHACLMPGYRVKKIPFHVAYVAHLRMHGYPQFTPASFKCE